MAEDKKQEGELRHTADFIEKYQGRIALVRSSHELYQKDNVPKAVEGYCKYLKIISQFKFVTVDKLRPALFDKQTEVAEILLISQVYWNLAKAYDRNPRLQGECQYCLEQFVRFSTGYRHQYINSEMIRKFIKRHVAYNPKLFESAYKKIQVQSKKCYVATYCFGEEALETNILRQFKARIQYSNLGYRFVCNYYRYAPLLVSFCEKHEAIGKLMTKLIIRPLLKAFVFCLR